MYCKKLYLALSDWNADHPLPLDLELNVASTHELGHVEEHFYFYTESYNMLGGNTV